jgi:hypothetical protein
MEGICNFLIWVWYTRESFHYVLSWVVWDVEMLYHHFFTALVHGSQGTEILWENRLPVCADDINLLGGNTNIHSTLALLVAREGVVAEVHIGGGGRERERKLMSHEQNAGQNHNMKIKPLEIWRSTDNWEGHWENQNAWLSQLRAYIKFRECLLPFGPECYTLPFSVEELEMKIYRIVNLTFPVDVKLGLLTLSEDIRLGSLKNRALKTVRGPKSDELPRNWRKLHNEKLCGLYSPDIVHNSCDGVGNTDRQGMWCVLGRAEGEHRVFMRGEGKRPLENMRVDSKLIK